jgi:hypothetical protein
MNAQTLKASAPKKPRWHKKQKKFAGDNHVSRSSFFRQGKSFACLDGTHREPSAVSRFQGGTGDL